MERLASADLYLDYESASICLSAWTSGNPLDLHPVPLVQDKRMFCQGAARELLSNGQLARALSRRTYIIYLPVCLAES